MEKQSGFIRTWIASRGFGFIVVPSKNRVPAKYYLHASKISSGVPFVGAEVLFDVAPILEGELASAIEVEIVTGGVK